jgi:hypothetical protein
MVEPSAQVMAETKMTLRKRLHWLIAFSVLVGSFCWRSRSMIAISLMRWMHGVKAWQIAMVSHTEDRNCQIETSQLWSTSQLFW